MREARPRGCEVPVWSMVYVQGFSEAAFCAREARKWEREVGGWSKR